MPRPTSREEALDQCAALWTELAERGTDNKHAIALAILGYKPQSGCPACEYALAYRNYTCADCPIISWSAAYIDKSVRTPCEDSGPYRAWLQAQSNVARQAAAHAMLVLIEESRG
jgi:hypothetical protein